MRAKVDFEGGSGNVFVNLGLNPENAEELTAKSMLIPRHDVG